ncbi:helix-turn-helix domain-containing protein [Streptomyces sp. NPDC001985]|uniref:AraC-like ligand-binding domain-containing protein n=1 Tax=Streptomyces sp. NPDC001985 TaxID=3154406 RepID=UPI003329F798
MIETVFRSEDVPAADRFESWRELVQRAHAPVELVSEHRADFRASQRLLEFGGVTVWPSRFQPVRFLRTPRLVRQSDPERVNLSLPTRGTLNVTRDDDREAAYDPFSFCLVDSSRSVDVRAGGPHEGIGFDIPRALLPLPADSISQLTGYRFSAREGTGALLADFLTRLSTDTHSFHPSDGPRLAIIAVDLASALFAKALDAGRALPPESRTRTLTLRLQAFIRTHLHDPALTPASVAAAHHISISYLHRLFRDQGTTVAALIRRLRLEGARRDLTGPAFLDTPIGDIALRWGFTSHASFTRTFHTAFGLSPRDCRHQAVDSTASENGTSR